MKNALSWIFAWLLASICTFIFASIAHSQFVLLELVNIDIAIPIGDWIGMTLSDIIGLSLGYGGVICVAMLLCFGLLSLINKRFKLPIWSYIIFAALAMAVMLLAMQHTSTAPQHRKAYMAYHTGSFPGVSAHLHTFGIC